MRRALVLKTLLTAASALACVWAGGAAAQSAPTNGAGLRYLSWPGKPPVGARLAPVQSPSHAPASAEPTPTVIAASRTLPLARLAPPPAATPSASTPRRGLTPASDWINPQAARNVPQAYPTPAPAQRPAETPAQIEAHTQVQGPAAQVADAPAPAAYQPAPQHAAPQPAPAPVPVPAPQVAAATQPAPVEPPAAQPTPDQPPSAQPPSAQAAADPMAPRRDAPIYRLMRPQSGVALDGAAIAGSQQAAQLPPGEQTARYYSVHRQAGRHPDTIVTPQPTYLDALPVQMTQTPKSDDLAQPDAPPALIRNANGSLRAAPQTQADDLP
ncbi:hypothetical protein SH203_01685 [Brevundimonas sp. SH203]|uniref:hypothetical protein n=1 Tax=Brevundimonas sp. SH203 TaxID=345167 RepID=UPI0009D02AE3|nr:hypothetical protein [Brevundimonas sp. SH203]GAW41281.1 hypothetical protein SH203_01685 [Brevundimonas sp. SH203]